MIDQMPAPAPADVPAIPSLWQAIAKALAQKALTALATFLFSYGVLANGQQGQFVSLGVSIVLWAISFAWTYEHEHHVIERWLDALNAPAPGAPPK